MAQRDNIITEQIGKELAISYEAKHGRRHVPFAKGEKHHGYDLKTFDEKTQTFRFIELKTSRKSHMINRWLEEHEQNCILNQPNYFVYYILDINVETKTGKIIVFSAEEWKKYYKKIERKFWYAFPKTTGLDRAIFTQVENSN